MSGEDLSIAAGALLTDVIQIKIIVNEEQFVDAMKIIATYEQTLKKPTQDGTTWECDKCNSVNPETFEICWGCQANRLTVV